MAIISTATLDFKGLQVPVVGAYSRFQRAVIDAFSGTSLFFKDYKDAASAKRILDKRSVGAVYDPNNPDHVAQYEAAGSPDFKELDAHGNPWQPTILEEYWDGQKCVGEALQEREIKLPSEIALAFAAHALVGDLPKVPAGALEALTAQAYLAALATGEFVDAVAV